MLMRHPLPALQFAYRLPYGANVTNKAFNLRYSVDLRRRCVFCCISMWTIANRRRSSSLTDATTVGGDVWSICVPHLKAGHSTICKLTVPLTRNRANGSMATRGSSIRTPRRCWVLPAYDRWCDSTLQMRGGRRRFRLGRGPAYPSSLTTATFTKCMSGLHPKQNVASRSSRNLSRVIEKDSVPQESRCNGS